VSDRDAFREAREHGLQKRHEQRLEHATYTAAEVKVLTETASKVAYELGRKDAGEVIIEAIRAERANPVRGWNRPGFGAMNALMTKEAMEMCEHIAAQVTRNPHWQPSAAVSDERSGEDKGPGVTCPACGLTDDHKGGCPQTGEAPRPGAPG